MAATELSFTRESITDQFPMALADVKDHLRIDFDDDDTRIKHLIKAVATEAQHFIGKPVYEATWKTGRVKLDLLSSIKIPYVQKAVVTDAASGAAIPGILQPRDHESLLTLENAYPDDVNVALIQQYISEDLELTLLLTVAFYYERRDLSRFSEQTLATLRKRLIYHRDAMVATGSAA